MRVKKPQPLPHTVQSTPEFDESFVTAALSVTVDPSNNCEGAKGTNAMECVLVETIVIEFDKTEVFEIALAAALILTGAPGEMGGAK